MLYICVLMGRIGQQEYLAELLAGSEALQLQRLAQDLHPALGLRRALRPQHHHLFRERRLEDVPVGLKEKKIWIVIHLVNIEITIILRILFEFETTTHLFSIPPQKNTSGTEN